MKSVVISYSLTGNNEVLANRIAEEFAMKHIRITEPKSRRMSSIILDMIFNRMPQVQPKPDILAQYDFILFFGPVWMGRVATPLRPYLKRLKTNPPRYAFISISGGAIGANPKLAGDLKKRAGKEPVALIDLHIADLLPPDPKPTIKDTSAYKIDEADIKKLTDIVVEAVKEIIENPEVKS